MQISIDGGTLHIDMTRWERTVAAHPGQIRVPIASIERAYVGWPRHGWRQLRVPGSFIPGLVKAGTYRWKDRKEFWLAWRGRERMTIELRNASYTAIVLGLADPAAWVETIQLAVSESG